MSYTIPDNISPLIASWQDNYHSIVSPPQDGFDVYFSEDVSPYENGKIEGVGDAGLKLIFYYRTSAGIFLSKKYEVTIPSNGFYNISLPYKNPYAKYIGISFSPDTKKNSKCFDWLTSI